MNWPDLRRDYDWPFLSRSLVVKLEWIDLIWEGITTRNSLSLTTCREPEWIDLIWEGITTTCREPNYAANKEWIDLIWEGITTVFLRNDCLFFPWVNWPDLRRDYDNADRVCSVAKTERVNWPDLRRDYDTSLIILAFMFYFLSELTWFEKGLRRTFPVFGLFHKATRSELTWFEKGLRPNISDFVPCTSALRVNWPDLRRDYDISKVFHPSSCTSEWIDLIWEGITT